MSGNVPPLDLNRLPMTAMGMHEAEFKAEGTQARDEQSNDEVWKPAQTARYGVRPPPTPDQRAATTRHDGVGKAKARARRAARDARRARDTGGIADVAVYGGRAGLAPQESSENRANATKRSGLWTTRENAVGFSQGRHARTPSTTPRDNVKAVATTARVPHAAEGTWRKALADPSAIVSSPPVSTLRAVRTKASVPEGVWREPHTRHVQPGADTSRLVLQHPLPLRGRTPAANQATVRTRMKQHSANESQISEDSELEMFGRGFAGYKHEHKANQAQCTVS